MERVIILSLAGKTGAFCLPIIQIVWETLKDLADGKGKKGTACGTGKFWYKSLNSELSKCMRSRGTVPPWTMSFFDRGNALAVTPDGLRCQSREFKEWHGCRATTGVKGNYHHPNYTACLKRRLN